MPRLIFCSKLQQELEGLEAPPIPGPLGQRVYAEISQTAWKEWLNHQTMLINEYRLNLIDKKAREFLYQEMEKHFFGSGVEKPQGFKPLNEEKE